MCARVCKVIRILLAYYLLYLLSALLVLVEYNTKSVLAHTCIAVICTNPINYISISVYLIYTHSDRQSHEDSDRPEGLAQQ
jgi:hypothetical protein